MVRRKAVAVIRSKRRIERIRTTVGHNANLAEGTIQLHIAEDAKTLVRIVLQLYLKQMLADAQVCMLLHKRPQGVAVVNAALGELGDQDTPVEEIWRYKWSGGLNAPASGIGSHLITLDTKAMRKMKPLDEIVLSELGTANNCAAMHGVIYMWFKE